MSDAAPFEDAEETFEEVEMDDGGGVSGSPSSSEAYPSEEEEEDELVDEMEDAEPMETNRRTRRPLRIKLSRSRAAPGTSSNSTPARRSGRRTTRTARARGGDAPSEESDEIASDDSETFASEVTDQPMTARQIARANRERGIQNEELVELPMGTFALVSHRRDQAAEAFGDGAGAPPLRDCPPSAQPEREEARGRQDRSTYSLIRLPQTINRLLKKQAGKVRGKERAEEQPEPRTKRAERDNGPRPLFRYVSRAEGAVLAVPLGPPFVNGNEAGEGLYDHALRTAFGASREAWAAAK